MITNINLIEFNWKNYVFTGLIKDKDNYFIIWGKSTTPIINIEVT